MRVVQLTVKPDADGMLRFAVPGGRADELYQVEITLTPQPAAPADGVRAAKTPEELGWPPGYFEKTAGSIPDPTFERGDQGRYETREAFG